MGNVPATPPSEQHAGGNVSANATSGMVPGSLLMTCRVLLMVPQSSPELSSLCVLGFIRV